MTDLIARSKKLLRRREATHEGYRPYDLVVRMELEEDLDVKEYFRYRSIYRDDDLVSRLKKTAIRAEIKRALKEEWT